MIRVERDHNQIVDFPHLRSYLNQAYAQSTIDHKNLQQTYEAVKNKEGNYYTLYKHLKQFVTSAPMIQKIQQYISGKVIK